MGLFNGQTEVDELERLQQETTTMSSQTMRFSLAKFLACSALLFATGAQAGEIGYVNDDYQAALKQARDQHTVLVANVYATWCPACKQMAKMVYTKDAMVEFSKGQVWLHVNFEDAQNKAFLDKFKVPGFPALLVIDPNKEAALASKIGMSKLDDIMKLIKDAS